MFILLCLMWIQTVSAEEVRIAVDVDRRETIIHVPAPDGRISWQRAVRGIAQAKGLDLSAFDAGVPDHELDLRLKRTRLVLGVVNIAL